MNQFKVNEQLEEEIVKIICQKVIKLRESSLFNGNIRRSKEKMNSSYSNDFVIKKINNKSKSPFYASEYNS